MEMGVDIFIRKHLVIGTEANSFEPSRDKQLAERLAAEIEKMLHLVFHPVHAH